MRVFSLTYLLGREDDAGRIGMVSLAASVTARRKCSNASPDVSRFAQLCYSSFNLTALSYLSRVASSDLRVE